MDDLKECVNWEQWWEGGAGGLDAAVAPEATEDSTVGDPGTQEGKELAEIDEAGEEEGEEVMTASEGASKSKAQKSREKRDLESLARGLVEIDITPSTTLSPSITAPTVTSAPTPAATTLSSEISQFVAKRKLVEFADGWERGRRVSLTCRRVIKVRKGMKLG